MGISSAGIGSGLDVASIVNQLVAAERAPAAARIDRTERQVGAKISALGTLRNAFDNLRSAVEKLTAEDTSQARKVSVPEDSNFGASAAAAAATGEYHVEVLALASAHQLSSTAYTDSQVRIGTGTLTIDTGETTLEVEIVEGDSTLDGIRDAINKAADGTGVTATIINADDGAHLVLTANETGAENEISISTSGGDGGLATLIDPANFTEVTAAADARVKVNGFVRTSSSNSVTDMIQGVTLNLTEAEPGTVETFTVSSDPSVMRGAVESLVSKYNAALDAIARTTEYDPTTDIAAALNGDAMVRGVSSDFRNAISSVTSELKALGITSDKEGKLTLDDAAFNEAIAEDPLAASRLFGTDGKLSADLEATLSRMLDEEDGLLTARDEALNSRTDDIADQRLALDRRMDRVEERYRKQFTALDVMVAQMQQTSSYLAQQLANLPTW